MKKLKNYLRSMSVITTAGLLSLLAMLSPLMTTTAKAQIGILQTPDGSVGVDFHPIIISERSFRRDGDDLDRFRLKDNDVIHLKMEKVQGLKDKVEIVLNSSSNVTWWKGITVFKGLTDVSDRRREVRFRHIDTQDDDHGDSVIMNVSDLGNFSYLTFEKAKAFGAHTPMYRFDLKGKEKNFKYAGMRLTFTWERDG